MPVINYSTPAGGGFQLDTPGGAGYGLGGVGAGFGPGMDLSWIGEFAKRQAQNKLAMSNLQLKQAREAGMGVHPSSLPPREDPLSAAVRQAQGTTEILKQQALQSQAPRKFYTGYGGPAWIAADPEMMTGIQRQLFLPQNNTFSGGGPSRMEASGFASDQAWEPNFSTRAQGMPSPGQNYAGTSPYPQQYRPPYPVQPQQQQGQQQGRG